MYRSRPAPVQCIDLIVKGAPLKAPPLKAAPLKAAPLKAVPLKPPPLGWTTPGVKVRPPHPPLSDRSDPPHPPLKAVPTLKAAPPRLYWVIEPPGLRWKPPPNRPPTPGCSPCRRAVVQVCGCGPCRRARIQVCVRSMQADPAPKLPPPTLKAAPPLGDQRWLHTTWRPATDLCGATPFCQVPDTHLHERLRRMYIDGELDIDSESATSQATSTCESMPSLSVDCD